MAGLMKLDDTQRDQRMKAAVEKGIPMTLTTKIDGQWCNHKARFVSHHEHHILIEPAPKREDAGAVSLEISPGMHLGVSFKFGNHKYVFSTTVIDLQQMCLSGKMAVVSSIAWPETLELMQRRNFYRAEIPAHHRPVATCWLGGLEAGPDATDAKIPTFHSQVADLSVGGVRLECQTGDVPELRVGQTVGIRVAFANQPQALMLEATFRHAEPMGNRIELGLQFIGLEHSDAGRLTLGQLSHAVSHYQRLEYKAQRRRPARCR